MEQTRPTEYVSTIRNNLLTLVKYLNFLDTRGNKIKHSRSGQIEVLYYYLTQMGKEIDPYAC